MSLGKYSNTNPLKQMWSLLAVSLIGFATLVLVAWNVIEEVRINGEAFKNMEQGKDLLADILPPPSYLLQLHNNALLLMTDLDAAETEKLIADTQNIATTYNKQHTLWASSTLPPDVIAHEKMAYDSGSAFIAAINGRFMNAIRIGDHAAARSLFNSELQPAFARHRAAIDELVESVRAYNSSIAVMTKSRIARGQQMLIGFGFALLILIGSWGVLLTRRVAEQRRAELKELQDEEQYRFALEAASLGAWEWNILTGEVHWSGGVESMFGLKKGEFSGTYAAYLRLVHPDDLKMVERNIASVVGGSVAAYRIEHRVLIPGGICRWLEAKGKVEKDTRGTPVLMRGTVSDITYRKSIETERDTLETKLRQSQRMEAVGKLAGGVAHDFNNILTGIMGYCELALRELNAHPARKRMEGIQKAAERAANLTKQLLAFSRKQILNPELLDINDVISNLQNMLERLLGDTIKLQVDLSKDLPAVKADRGQIEQVLLNLVVNARDAMPNGGRILIRTRSINASEAVTKWGILEETGNVLMIEVADEGPGIPPEIQAHLFQPYFTTKPEGKGTGLGLSTVYGIVQQSRGALGLDTEVGKGSTFKVYLTPTDEAPVKVSTRAIAEARGTLSGNILVAEDDARIRDLIKESLESFGFKVTPTEDADGALQILKENAIPIHLLLTDIMMPGKSGKVLAEEAATLHPDLKILFMSGFASDETIHTTIERLGAGLIHKPFTPDALYRRICSTLRGELVAEQKP